MTLSRFVAGSLAVALLATGHAAVAQDAFPTSTTDAPAPTIVAQEDVQLRVGDIFEIIADPGTDGAAYSWILTQERAFIEASREQRFRYRFVQEKTYTLRAEVMIGDVRTQRIIGITVVPQDGTPLQPAIPGGTGAMLVGTLPHPDPNGRIVLKPEQRILQLSPVRTDLTPLALDLDTARDTDGDGNPGNDVDAADTYFHSYGRSLWVWFARPLEQTEFVVTAIPAGSSPLVQRVAVLTEEAARGQGVFTSPVRIVAEQIDDATFAFRPELVQPLPDATPLLYEWELGDGNRSLDTTPTHTYATGDIFTVRLRVRDLQTGNTIGETELTVAPTVPDPIDEPEPDPIDEPEPDPIDEPVTDSWPWTRILLIGGIFIVSILIGVAIVWLLSFLRRSRTLEQTLESMEQTIAPAKEAAPPPLAIRKPAAPPAPASSAAPAKPVLAQQKVIDAEVSAASAPAMPPPTVAEANAPDWLKKGLTATPVAPAEAPKPYVAPSPKPAPQTPKPQPISTPAPAPAPTPAPKPPVAQPPKPTPSPVPTPRPATTPVMTPKPISAPPQPKPASPTTPPQPATPNPVPTPIPPPASKPAAAQPVRAPAPTPTLNPTAPAAPASTVPVPTAPRPVAPAPVPPLSTPPPTPMPPKPAFAPTPSPVPQTPPPDRLPHWLQPTPDGPAAPTNPAPPTPPPVPQPPAAQPPAPTPPSVLPSAPSAAPAAPQNPTPKKDDDPPIAFIRAENIGPQPAK